MGVIETVNSVFYQYQVDIGGVNLDQANFDGIMLLFFIFTPSYFYDYYINEVHYTILDICIATSGAFCAAIAIVFYGRGI